MKRIMIFVRVSISSFVSRFCSTVSSGTLNELSTRIEIEIFNDHKPQHQQSPFLLINIPIELMLPDLSSIRWSYSMTIDLFRQSDLFSWLVWREDPEFIRINVFRARHRSIERTCRPGCVQFGTVSLIVVDCVTLEVLLLSSLSVLELDFVDSFSLSF